MPFTEVGELRYYYFDLFRLAGMVHAVFTRQGGVSPAPWKSLNLGGLGGNSKENVVENRRKSSTRLDCRSSQFTMPGRSMEQTSFAPTGPDPWIWRM